MTVDRDAPCWFERPVDDDDDEIAAAHGGLPPEAAMRRLRQIVPWGGGRRPSRGDIARARRSR